MWVFTTEGFYSAVAHRDIPDMLMVRCRAELDALRLRDWMRKQGHQLEVEHTPTADYEWRVLVPQMSFAHFLMDHTARIDYPNFKNAVALRQGKTRHDIYADVWADMLRLQHPR